jgi:peptidyl-prolyl cis-trans isomerase C
MNKSRIFFGLGVIFCFLTGAYLWKVTRHTVRPTEVSFSDQDVLRSGVLVYVGDQSITTEDLALEYDIHAGDIADATDLNPAPKDIEHKDLNPLKERLLTSMIERKVLYQYLRKDSTFSSDDPARFTACLTEWQDAVNSLAPEKALHSEKLKQRLCERSLIEQYLAEKIFVDISIDNAEIKKYYEQNRKSLMKPKRVLIRQIVLETEEAANDVQKGLTRSNFAERAREFSITPEAADGGLIGPFAQGEFPQFFDYAFGMAKGEIYGNIKSNYGYHIILVEDQLKKQEPTLQEARKDIIRALTTEAKEKEYRKWIETAINTVPVKTSGSKS